MTYKILRIECFSTADLFGIARSLIAQGCELDLVWAGPRGKGLPGKAFRVRVSSPHFPAALASAKAARGVISAEVL